MFDKIGDLPLHPLVIHVVVIGIPLAVLLAVLFAFPKTRAWARWPLGITVVGATAATYVAKQSGLAFEAALGIKPGNPVGDLILKHSQLAEQLFWIMITFSVIGLLNVFSCRGVPRAAQKLLPSSPRSCVLCCRSCSWRWRWSPCYGSYESETSVLGQSGIRRRRRSFSLICNRIARIRGNGYTLM